MGHGRYKPTLDHVCPWLLLIVIAKAFMDEGGGLTSGEIFIGLDSDA
ncbi:uncharacterized protein G2W53_034043 [Senna tora]|uniref:Uncharacterized protein n=1 Tax=Senna tora TaxID=362788 RepID=A0A834W8J2_9FABA|nr:uncharacterized protein G2W53_034043 [Senna tora]